jgi:hypothetical protein
VSDQEMAMKLSMTLKRIATIPNLASPRLLVNLSLYEEHWTFGKLSKSEPQRNN